MLYLYYDGACGVCASEMKTYKKKDIKKQLCFVDISAPEFDADKEGLGGKDINKYFHIKDSEGRLFQGVSAFNKIWSDLEIFWPLQKAYAFGPSRLFMNLSYRVFVEVRPYLPKTKNKSCSI